MLLSRSRRGLTLTTPLALLTVVSGSLIACTQPVTPGCDAGEIVQQNRCVPIVVDVPSSPVDVPTIEDRPTPTMDVVVEDRPNTVDAADVPPPRDVMPMPMPSGKLDLLVVIDNSGSMEENQTNMMNQFGPLLNLLLNPPCLSRANPGAPPRACAPGNADDIPQYPPVTDLRIGVISTDLGTAGRFTPGCDAGDRGDNGLLNPIRRGPALQEHLPWAPRRMNARTAPAGFRPAACNNDPLQFPSFITYCSDANDRTCVQEGSNATSTVAATFADWFRCNAGLFVNGCGIEQPLESLWRALVQHDARSFPGNTSPNANFLRDDAVLAIMVFTDEEDGSVRQCANDQDFSRQSGRPCADATEVYNPASPLWASMNLDLRFYLATPGGAQDPTWNLDRYFNTAPPMVANRWSRDLLSLKPGHPEKIIFSAITGVPLTVPTTPNPVMGRPPLIAWNQLLGTPNPLDANDFSGRVSESSITGTQGPAGPFSMRGRNQDPNCAQVIPACRREGTTYNMAMPCINAQPMAYPSRRIVEIARRFDEFPACNGQPCRNGIVTSICAADLLANVRTIATRVQERLRGD